MQLRSLLILLLFFSFSCTRYHFMMDKEINEWASYYKKEEMWKEELQVLKHLVGKNPQKGYYHARIGLNYWRQNNNKEAAKYFENAINKGCAEDWVRNTLASISSKLGKEDLAAGKLEAAYKKFKIAIELKKENLDKGIFDYFLYKMSDKRRKLKDIKPECVQKIKVVFVANTDVKAMDGVEKAIKSSLNTEHKKQTIKCMTTLKYLWEAMSNGKFSLEFDTLEWAGTIRNVIIDEDYDNGETTPYRLNVDELSKNFSPVLEKTIDSTDTYVFIWSTAVPNLANCGGRIYKLANGKRYRRGFCQMSGERMIKHGYFLALHELFHSLESLSKTRPVHGFWDENRHNFPDWKGEGQYDYYYWHFKNKFPKLQGGFKYLSFLNQENRSFY